MTIFNKREMSYNWAKKICEKLMITGKIKPSELDKCIENAMRQYSDAIRDIDRRYLESIIGLDIDLAYKILREMNRLR